ncbi:MAG TPA: tetratricopeptide repeat protein [Thermoanaerobaculia bacterium]|nr:tetratricopeptide repeat protein [Thermoanaerobaculia bacterium]
MVHLLRFAPVWALFAAACATQPAVHPPHHAHSAAAAAPPPLFDDLGSYHRAVTTSSPAAQRYFDQGLRLVYAFNHYEALDAFREAARLDPGCALCHWGVALSLGSNYNSPTDAARERQAYEAVQAALAAAPRAAPWERALIEATARRHAADPPADRKPLDQAYADALRAARGRFPDDPEITTLFADAMMNLRPWDLWAQDGAPYEGTEEIVAALEHALALDPAHPGANHLYIHAVEASPDPGRGEAAADRLRGAMPGAGHVVHMPSHIYFRVGRYADARVVNEEAARADRAYFARRTPSDIYRMMYYPHNLDFTWQAAAMEGRGEEALRAARELASEVTVEMIAQMSDAEIASAAPLYALARFGRWAEVLREPEPPEGLFFTRGLRHYARGLALAAQGDPAAAAGELRALEEQIERTPAEKTYAGYFKTRDVLRLAADVLAGELAAKAGRHDEAVARLTAAVAAQDTHWFTEPPPWYYPVRHSLGAVLLAAGRPAEAEAVYREDLRRNPGNGWALFGLAQSLRAQGKTAEADQADADFRAAWAGADTQLTGSRF